MIPGPRSLVDLRKGEARPALRAFALLALLIGGHTLLETARDAIFLARLPASRLALVYGVVALVALVVSGPNARFARRFGEGRALVTTLILAATGTVLLYLQPSGPGIAIAVYVWSAFLGTVMVVQFWLFAARVFTSSQGARLFGPIAAGGVIGAIAGAGGAAVVLPFVPVRALLLGAAGAFVACALVAITLEPAPPAQRPTGPLAGPFGGEPLPASSPSPPPRRMLALFREYPYVGWLAALTALSTAAVLGADYLFKADAARRVAPEELGAYFARAYTILNVVALVVTLLVTGPLIRRWGVARVLLVMPLLLLGGAVLVIVTGAPMAVLLTKGADGALRHSMHRVTSELLGLPIPSEARPRTKPVLDGALARAVQAAMALVIFALAVTGHASPREIACLVAGLALAWALVALAIRRPHLDICRRALAKGSLDVERPLALDARLVRAVVDTMSSADPADVLAAMDLLVENGHARSIPSRVLHHPSDEVRFHALAQMTSGRRADWVPEVELLLRKPASEGVRVAAIRALSSVRALPTLAGLRAESPVEQAHLAVALTSAEPPGGELSSPRIQEVLGLAGEDGSAGRAALLDAIRDSGDRRFSGVIEAALAGASAPVVERAVLAMAAVRDPRFTATLVRHLHVRSTRAAVRDALVGLGEPAQAALEQALRAEDTAPAVRLHIPRTLSRFGNQRAADFLTEQLALDPSRLVRYKVLRGLGRLVVDKGVRVDREAILAQMHSHLIEHVQALARWAPLDRHPATREHLSGQLLLGLLEDKVRQSLERGFRLLHIAYRDEDIRAVYLSLRSSDRGARSSAMDFLDALTSDARGEVAHARRDLLKLVIDDLPAQEKVERAALYVPDAPADNESALVLLLRDRDASVAALAVYHALDLGLSRVVEQALAVERESPSLRDLTREALNGAAERRGSPDVDR